MDRISETFEAHNCREAAALRALDRAYERGAHKHLHDVRTEGDRVTARYADDRPVNYTVVVTPGYTSCTCEAGQHDRYCYHVAALADRAGVFHFLVHNFYTRAFPAPVAINPIEAARAEVDRLARNPKSTSDFHALQNARALLASLVESRELVAA